MSEQDVLLAPTKLDCGCIWSNRAYYWLRECAQHAHFEHATPHNTKRCYCLNVGRDDGVVTCMEHHDCRDGSCTHQDGSDG